MQIVFKAMILSRDHLAEDKPLEAGAGLFLEPLEQ